MDHPPHETQIRTNRVTFISGLLRSAIKNVFSFRNKRVSLFSQSSPPFSFLLPIDLCFSWKLFPESWDIFFGNSILKFSSLESHSAGNSLLASQFSFSFPLNSSFSPLSFDVSLFPEELDDSGNLNWSPLGMLIAESFIIVFEELEIFSIVESANSCLWLFDSFGLAWSWE